MSVTATLPAEAIGAEVPGTVIRCIYRDQPSKTRIRDRLRRPPGKQMPTLR